MRHLTQLSLAAVLLFAGCDTMKKSPDTQPMAKPATPATPATPVTSAPPAKPVETYALDAQGYIRNWLVLAPIKFGAAYNASDIAKEQIPGEANMSPKEGDKVKVKSEETVGTAAPAMVDKELTWQKVVPADHVIDFNAVAKLDGSEGTGGYAVAYLNAPEETRVTFSLSTNDNGKIYLNGTSVFEVVAGRQLAEDSDTVPGMVLKKGVNLLVFKVWNDSNNWQGCIRLLDAANQPVKNVKVQLEK